MSILLCETLTEPHSLAREFRRVRDQTERLCETLTPEDCVVQSMPDASPVRWHLAHTTWFFERFVLATLDSDYTPFDPHFEQLFNSYYNQVGKPFPRHQRGLLTRPGLEEVYRYRRGIDERIEDLLTPPPPKLKALLPTIELGLHHEQQHQELILTDVKHLFSCNPLGPVFRERANEDSPPAPPLEWFGPVDEGVYAIGHEGSGFCFDNETPRHKVYLPAFSLASRLVTNGEYLAFVDDGGYRRPELWLSLGWQTVESEAWHAPHYWQKQVSEWQEFTLAGWRPLRRSDPVCHVSYFEADAYARWAGCRLPTEAEWETASLNASSPDRGNFADDGVLHPTTCATPTEPLCQMWGDVWEWTASPYTPYPGYEPPVGAIGEYNGKFMCNQYVLRGGSCATPRGHVRPTYRNFFSPASRWQFSGIRLALS